MRPRREITWRDGYGWVIEASAVPGVVASDRWFSDLELARAVRTELDRVDPLPCPHGNGWDEIATFSGRVLSVRCSDCGKADNE